MIASSIHTQSRTSGRADPGDGPVVAAWHVGWAVAVAVLAFLARWLGDASPAIFYGLLAAIVPGLTGLGLLKRDGPRERMILLGLWGLSAVLTAALSGGLSGPLAALVFVPVTAGIALGSANRVRAGALGAASAALAGAVSIWIGAPGDILPWVSLMAGLLTVGATAIAAQVFWRRHETRTLQAEASALRAEQLLAGQPGLTLVLNPSGRPMAAYGIEPPGVPVDALFTDGLLASVHAPDRTAVSEALGRAASGLEGQVTFAPRRALDRRVQFNVRRLEDGTSPDGELRLIAQAFDATPQYVRELSLDTARAEAEAREAGKTRFLANMSHELRTPLNAILGFSDVMRQKLFGPLPSRYADYAEDIHAAGGHLLDLIGDVLDVSKIEAARYTLSPEPFDARETLSAAMAMVRVSAEDRDVALSSVFPEQPLTVTADRRALKQIALNLLSNAVKFTPAGGSVTVTAEAIGPYLEIVVSDTGVGIAADDLRRLGRPFEQAGGVEQRRQGTGLGLSLVRALAELHGGRMSLESTLGEGTAVTVRLPVAHVARPALPESGAQIIQMPVANGG